MRSVRTETARVRRPLRGEVLGGLEGLDGERTEVEVVEPESA